MMKERTLRVLEFTKIRDRLASKAMTDMGRERCEALVPSSNMTEIRRMQAETEEATVILQYVGASPLVPFSDVRASLTLAEKGATLSPKALLEVAALMQSARAARKALDTERDNTPILKELAQRLSTLHNVEQDITNAIISEDEIADRASNELMDIRRHLRGANERIKEKLNQMIRSSAFQKYLQDPIVTMRNDRYCLPVKAEYRGSVPGLVHDQSSTGATLFIEPMAAVEMGNELKTWAAKEKQEIERILAALSAEIAPYADQLRETVETLAELDYIFAKGMLSREMNAVSPKLNQNGYINIIRGRHPLIDREKVVPSNLWMGKDFTSLIITGPNTGGKTVTLKTVGLLTLMAQAGLQVPADLGTELAVFEQVFADIGDEQSIEQSLSTFSGHMTTIVSIMHEVTPDDLVLFDELGAGTDPTEGAALAQAILQRLLNIRVRTLATTHYSELKAFALSTKGVENASVEFDVETLRPTYRLSIGVPGKSNAFEISRRLGLPENLIDDAKKLLSSDSVRFEDVIANAEYHRQVAEREREIARQASAETVKLRDEAEKLRKQMEDQRENTIKKAKADARRIMEQTRRESESIIADLKRMKKEQQNPDAQVNAIRRRIENNVDNLSEGLLQKVDTGLPPKEVRKGDTVEILTIGSQGTVLAPANAKGEVEVQAGILKLKVNISQLRLVKQPDKPKPQPTSVHLKTGAMERTVRMECDVRGMALDEAIMTVDQYLDQAILAGMGEVEHHPRQRHGRSAQRHSAAFEASYACGELPPGRLWGRGERGHDCDAEIILLSEEFFIRRRGAPLRRRPEGFPIALWTPSVRTPVYWFVLLL